MSLLLDALKKAADDKQKASGNGEVQNQAPQKESADTNAVAKESAAASLKIETEVNKQPKQQTSKPGRALPEELSLQETGETTDIDPEALTLDDIDAKPDDHLAESDIKTDQINASPVETKQADELTLERDASHTSKHTGSGGFTVSDDALSMLIYKTNRDVKQGKKILIFSVLFVSLAILVSGGVFYYMDMQAEIAALERKHKIAMQSMHAKTSREKTPENTEVIRNLVSDPRLEEKVQVVKQNSASNKASVEKKAVQPQQKTNIKSAKKSQRIKAATPALSIQKTNKADPVGEKLDAAWLAYENGQYDEATKLYKGALSYEKNNRDALLGLGAIAIVEKNETQAKNIYLALLELDPRDPIAIAALASLNNDQSSLDNDKEYLLTMLQKNPNAHHLNFALGNLYAQQNKWKSAQQHYFNAWQYNSENADYLFNLAVSMDQLSKQEQAINFYTESLLKSKNKQVSFSREAVQKRISQLSGL